MKIAAHTLGCKLNFAETSHLLHQFSLQGWEVVAFDQPADVYLLNTCTVTATAEKKCRSAIRQALRLCPAAKVVVTGCFAQNNAQAIENIEGVALIVDNECKDALYDAVAALLQQTPAAEQPEHPLIHKVPTSFTPLFSREDRTRTFFKIQDGCDYFCSYCAIPFARGRSRSASIADTMAVARQIAESGAHEVVLTGINTGTFGQHQNESFLDLLRQLDALPIARYRISSIEPNLLTDEIIDFVAHSRAFLPHFHIPLQAGTDKVLSLMHRRYTTAFYAEKIRSIKEVMPHACIAADIIAGFNGEDEATFAQELEYLKTLPLSYLHIFTFSQRPRTAALTMPEVIPMEVRREHSARLHALSQQMRQQFYNEHIGQTRPVLWEETDHAGAMMGFTDNYIRLRRPYDPALVGQITPYTITAESLVSDFEPEG